MEHKDYSALPGVSWSALKDLATSPYRFWYLHVNPNRPEPRTSPEMLFGSALHCAILEPDQFNERYACALSQSDFPGLLVTIDNLRQWLRDRGITPKGSLKADIINQVRNVFEMGHAGEEPPLIWDLMVEAHGQENTGKVQFQKDDWTRITNCAASLRDEPKMQELLKEGEAEVWLEAKDPETGVLLRGLLDWVTPEYTLDIKTYQQTRESQSIDKTISNALWYNGYINQLYLYTMLRDLNGQHGHHPVIGFIESQPPHEARIKTFGPKVGGTASQYWITSRFEVRRLIQLYAACVERYGDKPWREPRMIETITDEDLPMQAWS